MQTFLFSFFPYSSRQKFHTPTGLFLFSCKPRQMFAAEHCPQSQMQIGDLKRLNIMLQRETFSPTHCNSSRTNLVANYPYNPVGLPAHQASNWLTRSSLAYQLIISFQRKDRLNLLLEHLSFVDLTAFDWTVWHVPKSNAVAF